MHLPEFFPVNDEHGALATLILTKLSAYLNRTFDVVLSQKFFDNFNVLVVPPTKAGTSHADRYMRHFLAFLASRSLLISEIKVLTSALWQTLSPTQTVGPLSHFSKQKVAEISTLSFQSSFSARLRRL